MRAFPHVLVALGFLVLIAEGRPGLRGRGETASGVVEVSRGAFLPQVMGTWGPAEVQRDVHSPWSPIGLETPLREGDRLRTGPHGSVEAILDGGLWLRLEPDSELSLGLLRRGPGGSRGVDLRLHSGTAICRVEALEEGSSFQVHTPVAVAAVHGTAFRTWTDGRGCRVDVIQGEVVLSRADDPARSARVGAGSAGWVRARDAAEGADSRAGGGLGAGDSRAAVDGVAVGEMDAEDRSSLARATAPAYLHAGEDRAPPVASREGVLAADLEAIRAIIEECRVAVESGRPEPCLRYAADGLRVEGMAAGQLLAEFRTRTAHLRAVQVAVERTDLVPSGDKVGCFFSLVASGEAADGHRRRARVSGTLSFGKVQGRWRVVAAAYR
ncbi:MAG: FecR domain-containing protein [Planctomycetes bacterium]|nr:FecR domain-containing protein [Planctomycetota bacterium]